MFTDELNVKLTELMDSIAEDDTRPEYARMRYPKLIPFMRFETKKYKVGDFGSVMIMQTKAAGGAMKLMTVSFMPYTGKTVPYLLIDCMAMKNKSLAYVEYYDCTGKELAPESLKEIKERYRDVPDYAEKDAWYVGERMDASLIKGGKSADGERLMNMVMDSVSAYLELVREVDTDSSCLPELVNFRKRMIEKGNPSTPVMSKVLGKEEANRFFMECVMPLED